MFCLCFSMRFHTPFFFFSNSTFADGHCKGHNLLLSWRAYMNCVQRRRKHAKKQEGHLLRTHPHSTDLNPHSWRISQKKLSYQETAHLRVGTSLDHLDDPSASPHRLWRSWRQRCQSFRKSHAALRHQRNSLRRFSRVERC